IASLVVYLLYVVRHLVIDWICGLEHCGAGPDHTSLFSANFDPVVSLVMRDIGRVRVEPAAAGEDRSGKSGGVFGRVKAPLVGEPQCPTCIDPRNGRAIHPINIDVDLAAGLIFLFETCAMAFLCREKETVDSRKIGVDAFLSADSLDTVHGRDLAVVVNTRLTFTAHADA